MDRINKLASAIRRAALEATPNHLVTESEVRALAAQAKIVNEETLNFLSDLPPARSETHYVSLQLIRAAFDHARGLLYLLETNQNDMAGPALALHRSQIENFLRGVYLGFIASEEQLLDFLESDLGIREKNKNGKWKIVGVSALAQRVEAFIDAMSGESSRDAKLSRMVENAWSPLCGFVHGGRAVHAMYIDGQGQIGGHIPTDVLVQCIGNCYAVTNYGFLIVVARIYKLSGIPVGSPLQKAMEDFIRLHRSVCKK